MAPRFAPSVVRRLVLSLMFRRKRWAQKRVAAGSTPRQVQGPRSGPFWPLELPRQSWPQSLPDSDSRMARPMEQAADAQRPKDKAHAAEEEEAGVAAGVVAGVSGKV